MARFLDEGMRLPKAALSIWDLDPRATRGLTPDYVRTLASHASDALRTELWQRLWPLTGEAGPIPPAPPPFFPDLSG